MALLHGDCNLDNVIYHHDGLAYLVDLEDTYIGNPASDLGYTYHFVSFAAWPKLELAEDFIDAYQNLHGEVAVLEVYKKLAALQLVVLIRFLLGIDALSPPLIGFKKKAGLIALKRCFSAFLNYYLTYAGECKAELKIWCRQ